MKPLHEIMAFDPVSILGAFVGVVGISIALWLQMVAPRKCHPRHVLAFFGFGSIFLLTNADAIALTGPIVPASAALGLLVALVFEVAGAWYIYRNFSEPRNETDYVERVVDRFHGLR
ncbi:putative membrane protein [Halorubrum phage Hardycor1]|nr:putative membrane protein [Halorubrum phage Hardycor1]